MKLLLKGLKYFKMGALLSTVVSVVKSFSKETALVHPLGLPLPPVLHKTLDDYFINSFSEILVIGDVHGCLDELIELLNENKAMDNSTLKLYVGDLVNKGPKNKEVLEFLMKTPSMYSVRGNHDEVVLREYESAKDPNYTMKKKNLWMKDLTPEQIQYLHNLPYTIQLPSLNSVIVHAGLIPGCPINSTPLQDMVTMRNLVFNDQWEEGGIKASKNSSEGEPWAPVWNGPYHVYFGHDAKRMLQLHKYCTGLDTGCVYGNFLTGMFIKGPRKGKLISVAAKHVYQKPGGNG